MGSIPVQAWILSGFFFSTVEVETPSLRSSSYNSIVICSSNICLFHILMFVTNFVSSVIVLWIKLTFKVKADMSVALKCLSRYVFLNSTLKTSDIFQISRQPDLLLLSPWEELNRGEAVKKRNSKQLITEVSSFSYSSPWVGVHVPERMTKITQNKQCLNSCNRQRFPLRFELLIWDCLSSNSN